MTDVGLVNSSQVSISDTLGPEKGSISDTLVPKKGSANDRIIRLV